MKLVYSNNGVEVKAGDPAKTFRGESVTVKAIIKPRSPQSTGRVEIEIDGGTAENYPSVIGAEWVGREDQTHH